MLISECRISGGSGSLARRPEFMEGAPLAHMRRRAGLRSNLQGNKEQLTAGCSVAKQDCTCMRLRINTQVAEPKARQPSCLRSGGLGAASCRTVCAPAVAPLGSCICAPIRCHGAAAGTLPSVPLDELQHEGVDQIGRLVLQRRQTGGMGRHGTSLHGRERLGAECVGWMQCAGAVACRRGAWRGVAIALFDEWPCHEAARDVHGMARHCTAWHGMA